MQRFLTFSRILLAAALFAAPGASAETNALRLGILPHLSARLLAINFAPLQSHLADELGRAVAIESAPNFKEYHKRSLAGDYDIFATAANLGRLAQVDGQHVPIAMFEPAISGILVTLKDARMDDVSALRGKTLALANPQSLVVLKGLHWLGSQGLTVDVDFKTVRTQNEDSLGHVLATGDAPFAMMSIGEFRAIGPALRDRLRIFQEFGKVPGFIVLLRRGLPEDDARRIRAAVLSFSQSTRADMFKARTGTVTIREIHKSDLEAVDDVLAETRSMLR